MSSRSSAVSTSGVLRKGTIVILAPVADLRSSADRFCVLPGLIVPTLNRPGLARAAARTSVIVRRGESALVRINRSKNATVEIGAKSATGSNGMVLSSELLIAIPLESTNRV